jgi:hypothetical protein
MALLDEAQNIEEYAFALGFMCHYSSDVLGHALGTNPAVPLLFKKARKKFGDSVNYEQCPSYHARAEFGFDVLQSAKGNYEPDSYHDFIGFKISEPVLERAFLKTYGLELNDIFRSMTVATKTFRFAVRNMFPTLTKSAWLVRRASPDRLNPLARKKDYIYKMDRKTFKKEFGRPGLKSSAFAVLIFVLPKIGPTAGLKFKTPNPEVQELFDASFDAIHSQYSGALKTLITQEKISLENLNWDTGKKTVPGEYELTDKTYCDLLLKLEKSNFEGVNAALKESFLKYYSDPADLKAPKVRSGQWKKIEAALERLKTVNIE